MKKFWDKYRFVILAFVVWRVALFFAELISLTIPIFSKTYVGPIPWANTDGINYIRIAQWGYGSLNEAFFPLYPLLLRGIHYLIPAPLEMIGVAVSTICFFIGLIVLYGIVARTSAKQAKWCIVFILAFPTAFFFTAVYTEALFFLLTVLVVYFSLEKKWLLAGICVGVAGATRIVGICTAVFVLYELWKTKYRLRPLDMVGIAVMPMGILSYMWFLLKAFNDPLRFIHIQALYEINRTVGHVVLLPQVLWRYMKILVLAVGKPTMVAYGVSIFELVLTLGAFYILYYGWKHKLRGSYVLYSLVALIIPTLTGTLTSMPRYILTVVPLFMVLGSIGPKTLRYVLLIVSVILEIMATTFFLRGWFIA
jgi:Gpi18-like mannosyltransferase